MKTIIKLILLITTLSIVGCGDGGSKKWRLDNPNLTEEEKASLDFAIATRDEINKKKIWDDLTGSEWSGILCFFPEEAKRCRELKGFDKFSGNDWGKLLQEEPRFEKECEKRNGFKAMSAKDWISLISAQTKYFKKAKKMNVLKGFTTEDWKNAIVTKNPEMLKEVDTQNIWAKFEFKDWIELLKLKIVDEKTLEKSDILKKMNSSQWGKLIELDEKYIELSKKHNAFSNIDNKTWTKTLSKNKEILDVLEKEGVFQKFSPNNWTSLLISNPEFLEVAKKANALKKYSKEDLIRLYVFRPEWRNEIFAINKIDIEMAEKVRDLHRKFGASFLHSYGSRLKAEELEILVKIFPEKLDKLSESSFSNYATNDWKYALISPTLFKIISKKFAYLVTWEEFKLLDWIELLNSNPHLQNIFKNTVKVNEIKYLEIYETIQTKEGYDAFNKYNFWSQLTTYQYVQLVSSSMCQTTNDARFMISKAKESGALRLFTTEDWNNLFKDILYDNSREDILVLLSKEYFDLKIHNPILTEKIIMCRNVRILSENNLWIRLDFRHWERLLSGGKDSSFKIAVKNFVSLDLSTRFDNIQMSHLFMRIFERVSRFAQNDKSELSDQLFENFGFTRWDKISKNMWGYIFCHISADDYYLEKSNFNSWSTKDIFGFFEKYYVPSAPSRLRARFANVYELKLPDIINFADLDEAARLIQKKPSLFLSYKKKGEFKLEHIVQMMTTKGSSVQAWLGRNPCIEGKEFTRDDIDMLNLYAKYFHGDKHLLYLYVEANTVCSLLNSSYHLNLLCKKCKKKYNNVLSPILDLKNLTAFENSMKFHRLRKNGYIEKEATKDCKHEWILKLKDQTSAKENTVVKKTQKKRMNAKEFLEAKNIKRYRKGDNRDRSGKPCYYQCSKCSKSMVVDSVPLDSNCPQGELHRWNNLGEVSETTYALQCSNCLIIIRTKTLPPSRDCPMGLLHEWKLHHL